MGSDQRYDVIIVGSGIAGLSVALRLAESGHSVAIITKKDSAESNTNYAQGGIAAVTSNSDDIELHVQDTLEAGDGLCDAKVVNEILRDGPSGIERLIETGVSFSMLEDGRISLGKEGGHSKRRILHVEDRTGKAIEEALLNAIDQHPKIKTLEHSFAVELITIDKLKRAYPTITDENRVVGLFVYNVIDQQVETFEAKAVFLATGGIGQIYQFTTNPSIATGDGIAMAYRAGAVIENMEFIQFHPTALYSQKNERFLISEALRGEGAILRNLKGEAFMSQYDQRGDLAPRDVVARSIDTEMKRSGAEHLWLDASPIGSETLRRRFPSIYNYCQAQGLAIDVSWIPIVPAAHYLCGGIQTSLNSETSLKGLYACGEVACTGLHGANRLASNSLLEAVVMANRGALEMDRYIRQIEHFDLAAIQWVDGDLEISDERVVLTHNKEELKRTMWDYVSIVRTDKRLDRAWNRLVNLEKEITEYYWNFKVDVSLLELRNMITTAKLVVLSAMQRKESRGLHYSLDYPEKSDCVQTTRLESNSMREFSNAKTDKN
ncbi:MAG: L-aspartate oxidase [Puniceicoccaceae bacterium]|nr:L-aspartate oxidase [Puniceicoccaceae bacterium]RCL31177.1 MAG: L-aspartate oxidase [Puniceicoccaceae bacterium]